MLPAGRILLLFIVSLFLLPATFAVCTPGPEVLVRVESLDTFSQVYAITDPIPIKGDYSTFPLQITFFMEFFEEGCVEEAGALFRLSQAGTFREPVSFKETVLEDSFEVEATFSFDFTNEQVFIGNFQVAPRGIAPVSYDVQFVPDTFAPVISFTSSVLFSEREGELFSLDAAQGTDMNLAVGVSDASSIQQFCFDLECVDVEGNEFAEEYVIPLESSQTITLAASDIVGNRKELRLNVIIDEFVPEIVEVTSLSLEPAFETIISALITDEDVDLGRLVTVQADFSSFSQPGLVPGACTLVPEGQRCSWQVPVVAASTQNFPITFVLEDSSSNSVEIVQNVRVVADKNPPVAIEFGTINELDVKNIVSPEGEAFLRVELSDDSFIRSIDVVFANEPLFSFDPELSNPENNVFVWNVSEALAAFSEVASQQIVATLVAVDAFGNTLQEQTTILVDNSPPVIFSAAVTESDKNLIKDGFLSFEEFMDYTIVTTNNVNLKKVIGDFSSVAINGEKSARVEGKCRQTGDNNSQVECVFRDIQVLPGFLNETVFISLTTDAGLQKLFKDTVIIFNVANESLAAFTIPPVKITNPLERNMILNNFEIFAWFEGQIVPRKISGQDADREIISYTLGPCNDSGISPLLLEQIELYPSGEGKSKDFLVRSKFSPIQDAFALENGFATCSLIVQNKNATTLFPDEIVPFEMEYVFFNLPRGDVVQARAEKLNEMMARVKFNNNILKTFFKLYNVLNGLCELFGVINGALSTVTTAFGTGSIVVDAFLPGSGTATAPLFCTDRKFSLLKWNQISENVGKICGFITCEANKQILGGQLFAWYEDTINGLASTFDMCQVATSQTSEAGEAAVPEGESVPEPAPTPTPAAQEGGV